MYTNTTEECKQVIGRSSRTFVASFVMDEIRYSDVKRLKLSVPSTANGKITVGGTVSNSVEIVLGKVGIKTGKKISVFEAVKLDSGEYEDVPMGKFTVINATTRDSMTTILAEGPLSTETTLGYFSNLEYPATTIQMLNEISACIEVPIVVEGLEEIYVDTALEGYTYREVIGFIAALHGTNAVETRDGNIAFKWYENCEDDIFTDKSDSPEMENDLFVVNKFDCYQDNQTISRGDGYTGIAISNPLMTESIADSVWNKISGFTYRGASFSVKSGTPCVDVWDSFTYNDETVIATELQYIHDGGLQNVYKSVGGNENTSNVQGPVSKMLGRYHAELVIVKEALVNTLTVEQADIRYARVDALDVIAAEIEDAVIKNLDADIVTAEQLNATNARIIVLEVNSLTANSAVIKDLQAGVADINTLIYGTASGSSIHSDFSNAVVAQIGSAQIKSAMIESLSADKIQSGSLYTNLVHIYGDASNKLSIVDNTIAISDGTRTRVQIGKDVSNDYNMYVWDSDGNLMFDALGLTEGGITRQIIRDDVVKDDANISANKLNIESLFTVINEDGSHTLNSSKIYLDEKAQTLDIAFQSMTTQVTSLQTTQSSQGTQLSVIQGQISSKVWQQDIDTAVDDVEGDISTLTTKYASLNQTVSGLSSTVSSHTTSINSLGTKMSSAETSITQHSDLIATKVSKDDVISSINQSAEIIQISASKVNLVGAVTFTSLDSSTQSQINTANTNASEALLRTEVETVVGNVKKFKNVCGYTYDNGTITGYLIITTPITPNRMVSIHVSGYNYVNASETIDLTIGFYNYSTAFISNGFVNKGSFPISSVQVAKVSSSDTRAVIIIGTASTVWTYPKIIVDEVFTGFSTVAPDSYKDGFSVAITATLPATYVHKLTIAGTDLKALSVANNQAIANWCYNNDETYINGAKIYTGSVSAAQIDVSDLFAQTITATGQISNTTSNGSYLKIDMTNMMIESADASSALLPALADYYTMTGYYPAKWSSFSTSNIGTVGYPYMKIDNGILVLNNTTYDSVGIIFGTSRKLRLTGNGVYTPNLSTDGIACKGTVACNTINTENLNTGTISALGNATITGTITAGVVKTAAGINLGEAATTSTSGLMTASMVTKLNGIETGANKTPFSNLYTYVIANGTATAFSQIGAYNMYVALTNLMNNNFNHDGDVLIPYANVSTLNADVAVTATVYTDWTVYKGFVIGVASNNGVEWMETKYIPRNLVQSAALGGLNTIRMQVYDNYIYEGSCIIDVANHKATFKSYRLTGWTEARAFVYGIK